MFQKLGNRTQVHLQYCTKKRRFYNANKY